MELNIALVVGFVIWCGISCALNLYLWFRRKEDAYSYDGTVETWKDIVDQQRTNADQWRDKYSKLVQLIGEVATIGGYDPENDGSWAKLSWKRDDVQ